MPGVVKTHQGWKHAKHLQVKQWVTKIPALRGFSLENIFWICCRSPVRWEKKPDRNGFSLVCFMNCYRPIIDSCVFEGVNVTLPKGQRRVNGFMQQQGLEESFPPPTCEVKAVRKMRKWWRVEWGEFLQGNLSGMQWSCIICRCLLEVVCVSVFWGREGGTEIEKGRERQVMI